MPPQKPKNHPQRPKKDPKSIPNGSMIDLKSTPEAPKSIPEAPEAPKRCPRRLFGNIF